MNHMTYIYRADNEIFRVFEDHPINHFNDRYMPSPFDHVVPGYNHFIEQSKASKGKLTIDSILAGLTESLKIRTETDTWLTENNIDFKRHESVRRIWAFRTEVDAIHFKLRFS